MRTKTNNKYSWVNEVDEIENKLEIILKNLEFPLNFAKQNANLLTIELKGTVRKCLEILHKLDIDVVTRTLQILLVGGDYYLFSEFFFHSISLNWTLLVQDA